jgi:hypothetical protein
MTMRAVSSSLSQRELLSATSQTEYSPLTNAPSFLQRAGKTSPVRGAQIAPSTWPEMDGRYGRLCRRVIHFSAASILLPLLALLSHPPGAYAAAPLRHQAEDTNVSSTDILSLVTSTGQPPVDTRTSVYASGELTGLFATCIAPATSPSSCYTASPYQERATFVFRRPRASERNSSVVSTHLKPIATATGGRAAPQVADYSYDETTGDGRFDVMYVCASPQDSEADAVHAEGRNDSSVIRLRVPLATNVSASVELMWIKVCGSGKMPFADIGYVDADNRMVLFNGDGTHGDAKEVGLEFGPNQPTTSLALRLREPAVILSYHAAHVTSSVPEKVGFSVRGSRTKGTLNRATPEGDEAKVSIIYNCNSAGTAEFSASFAIPPWRNLTASWTKDCGGGLPKSLLIGMDTKFDVFQDSELDPRFNATGIGAEAAIASAAASPGPSQVALLDESKHSVLFFLSNIDASSELHFQSVSLSISPPKVMFSEIETPSLPPLIGNGYLSPTGGIIPRKGALRLDLRFYCREAGSVIVMVTLAMLLYDNVEFSFVKHCAEGHVHHRSAATAGSVLGAMLVACVATACMVCIVMIGKRRRDALLSHTQPRTGSPTSRNDKPNTRKGAYRLVDDDELEY